MNYINLGIEFLKSNWITIGLVVFALITVLSAWVKFKIRLAKITPDKADDIEAEIEAKKVNAFIQLLKDIFLPSPRKKKNDGGFADPTLILVCVGILFGLIAGAFLNQRFRDPEVVKVDVPEYVEVIKTVEVKADQKQGKVNTVKEYNCANGGVSKEVTVEEYSEAHQSQSNVESAKKSEELKHESLDLFAGLGAQIQTGDKLRDIEKIKPQLAAGAAYSGWGGFAASDGNSSHNLILLKRWSLQ